MNHQSKAGADPQLTAADVMTGNVQTVPADATLREAAQLLHQHDIGGAPVLDPNTGQIVGMLSEADLLNVAKKRAALPHIAAFGLFLAPEESLRRIYEDGATLLVEEVMTRRVISVNLDTPIAEVGDLLLQQKINRVPVLNDGKLVGIVTRHDLLRGVFRLG
jgi:CBS domain-containing protein